MHNYDVVASIDLHLLPIFMLLRRPLNTKLQDTHTFSTPEEIDTEEIWVDGKRIYRKVIKTTDTISPNETLALYWDTGYNQLQ